MNSHIEKIKDLDPHLVTTYKLMKMAEKLAVYINENADKNQNRFGSLKDSINSWIDGNENIEQVLKEQLKDVSLDKEFREHIKSTINQYFEETRDKRLKTAKAMAIVNNTDASDDTIRNNLSESDNKIINTIAENLEKQFKRRLKKVDAEISFEEHTQALLQEICEGLRFSSFNERANDSDFNHAYQNVINEYKEAVENLPGKPRYYKAVDKGRYNDIMKLNHNMSAEESNSLFRLYMLADAILFTGILYSSQMLADQHAFVRLLLSGLTAMLASVIAVVIDICATVAGHELFDISPDTLLIHDVVSKLPKLGFEALRSTGLAGANGVMALNYNVHDHTNMPDFTVVEFPLDENGLLDVEAIEAYIEQCTKYASSYPGFNAEAVRDMFPAHHNKKPDRSRLELKAANDDEPGHEANAADELRQKTKRLNKANFKNGESGVV